ETRVEPEAAGHLDRVEPRHQLAHIVAPRIERERFHGLRARPLEVLARGAAVRDPDPVLRVPRVEIARGAERETRLLALPRAQEEVALERVRRGRVRMAEEEAPDARPRLV